REQVIKFSNKSRTLGVGLAGGVATVRGEPAQVHSRATWIRVGTRITVVTPAGYRFVDPSGVTVTRHYTPSKPAVSNLVPQCPQRSHRRTAILHTTASVGYINHKHRMSVGPECRF